MLKMSSSFLNARGEYSAGKARQKAGRTEANMYLESAKARLARGTREAKQYGHQGKVNVSDATAALVGGQGAAFDPALIAKIKAKTDYNALAALFESQQESFGLRQRAIDTRYSAGMGRSVSHIKTAASALTGVRTAGSSFGDWMKTKNQPRGTERF
jgi:hypothetical protein